MKILIRIAILIALAVAVGYMIKGDMEIEKKEAQAIEFARQCMISNYTNVGCR